MKTPQVPEREEERNVWAERLTLAVSASILLIVVALIGVQALIPDDAPPVIAVAPRFNEMRNEGGLHYLPVDVTNRGKRTAGDVAVTFTLTTADGATESAGFTITFLPGSATDRGIVVFSQDPTDGMLSYTVGFKEP